MCRVGRMVILANWIPGEWALQARLQWLPGILAKDACLIYRDLGARVSLGWVWEAEQLTVEKGQVMGFPPPLPLPHSILCPES